MEEAETVDLEKLSSPSGGRTLFLNKVVVSTKVFEWEANLTKTFTEYIDGVNRGYIKVNKVNERDIWHSCWRWILWIYGELKHNKIEQLRSKEPQAYDQLKEVVEKRLKQKELGHEDLIMAYDNITKFISLAGYHDDTIRSKEGSLDEEEW